MLVFGTFFSSYGLWGVADREKELGSGDDVKRKSKVWWY